MPERAVNKDAAAKVTSMAPDVCLTPMGSSMVPVPYTITSHFNVAENTAPKVNYGGLPAFTMASRLPRVEGDEQGTGGGIISKVNLGYCRPVEHSGTVKAHKQHVVRQGDLMHMNCNGPDGPANTYGRIEYIGVGDAGQVSRETLHKEQRVTFDQATGKTVVEERTITRDPETGAITETRQRTEIDPSTGEIRTESASLTQSADGARSYETASGHFDPANKSYQWETAEGNLPSSAFGESGPIVGDGAIGAINGDGQLYPVADIYEDPAAQLPNGDLGIDGSEGVLNEGDLLSDPEYQAALGEAAAAQAEIDAINKELVWEGAKTAADVAGIFDPTPASDTIAAGMALSDGDFVGAGLSLLSWIPYLGDAVAKPIKGTRAAAKILALTQKLEKIKDKLKKAQDVLEKLKQKFKNAVKKTPDGRNKVPDKPKNPGDGGNVPNPKNPYTKLSREQLEKAKKSFEKRVKEHEQKLADYKSDPFKQDNLGKLKDAPPELQQKMIDGRIRELESQLTKQRGELLKVVDALKSLGE
ncbi:MAG: DUF4150 domain-containing protein [Polyangiaceae bacterium]|nr:DUF4150 domain-containing protein [Polyangiaceae bacterium]